MMVFPIVLLVDRHTYHTFPITGARNERHVLFAGRYRDAIEFLVSRGKD